MGDQVKLLHDTHLLVVDQSGLRQTIVEMLEGMGATVHVAESQLQAVGMYYRLYRQNIRPRAVITDWWMKPPTSPEHTFIKRYCPDEDPCAATSVVTLMESVHDLDPATFLVVYTSDVDDAKVCLSHRGIPAVIVDRAQVKPDDFAVKLATHEGIAQQRVEPQAAREVLKRLVSTSLFGTPRSA